MKESDFYEWLETQPVEDKIVSIKYKYSHEKEWTQSNEILEVDLSYEDVYVWLDDWDEGQQDIEILGCISVSDINVPIFDHKTESNSEKPNNCEHITEDGVTCARYPACDDCLDNPLNKVKGSERLVKGSEQTEPTISKMEQVVEPTGYCNECKWYGDKQVCGRCRSRNLFEPKDEPQKHCHRPNNVACHPEQGDMWCRGCDYWYANEPQTERSE